MSINAISYLTGNSEYQAGIFKRGPVGVNMSKTLTGNFRWWNKVSALSTQYIIYTDSYTTNSTSQSAAIPTAWSTPNLTDQALVNLINTIPERIGQTPFVTATQAVNWLNQTNRYFLLKNDYENIVTDGLVLNLDAGWYDSYVGSGNVWNDLSGNNSNGTLVNGPVFSQLDNGSLNFDGTDDYAQVIQTLSAPITVCGWVRYNNQSKTNNTFIDISPHQVLVISINRTGIGDTYVFIGNGSSWQGSPGIMASQPMNINTWYHVAFVSNGSGSILYINGINVGTSGYSPSGFGSFYRFGTLAFGASLEMLNGNIATTTIYNTALTQTQILQNFNAQAYRFGVNNNVSTSGLGLFSNAKNLLSYPGSGTAWYDLTGNNNTGTLTNGPTYNSNGYITFDGTDDYVNYGNIFAFDRTDPFSVCFLIKAPTQSAYLAVINKLVWEFGAKGWRVLSDNNGPGLTFTLADYHTVSDITIYIPNVLNNEWRYVCFTYDGNGRTNGMEGYIDGNLYTSGGGGNLTSSTVSTTQLGVFGGDGTYNTGNGSVSNVMIYNRKISAAEVKQNYYQGNIVTDNLVFALDAGNLVSYPGSGTTWKELGGSGINETLINGPTFSTSNGGYISFDGTNDRATTSSTPSSLLGNPNFTICGWFRRTGTISPNTGTWGLGGESMGGGICSWVNNSTDEISIDMWGTSSFTTGVTYPLNEWVFAAWQKIAGNFTTANCIIWRNLVSYTGNQLIITRPEGGTPTINNVGITLASISPNYGTISPIQIANFYAYNRVLSPTEIQQNFNAQKSRFGL